ncbi:hypothetical protein GCM10009122_40570 [Fulvivirga kasyanovii]
MSIITLSVVVKNGITIYNQILHDIDTALTYSNIVLTIYYQLNNKYRLNIPRIGGSNAR